MPNQHTMKAYGDVSIKLLDFLALVLDGED